VNNKQETAQLHPSHEGKRRRKRTTVRTETTIGSKPRQEETGEHQSHEEPRSSQESRVEEKEDVTEKEDQETQEEDEHLKSMVRSRTGSNLSISSLSSYSPVEVYIARGALTDESDVELDGQFSLLNQSHHRHYTSLFSCNSSSTGIA